MLLWLLSCSSGVDVSVPDLGSPPSWTGPEVAVLVKEGESYRPVVSTSTATFRVSTEGKEQLRMFGVPTPAFFREERRWSSPSPLTDCPPSTGGMGRLESFVGTNGVFRFDGAAQQSPCKSSCIPIQRDAMNWPLVIRDHYAPKRDTVREKAVTVTYRDPSVFPVDGLGWMLVMTRNKVLGDAGQGELLPHESLGDVVGWVAPDPSFSRGTKGPFHLVDDLEARDDLDMRAWLGVPGGVSVGEGKDSWIYLYYATEVPKEPYVDNAAGYSDEGFLAGASVKRIPPGAVRERAESGPKKWDEGRWNGQQVIDGQLLGRVRIWVPKQGAIAGGMLEVVPLESLYADRSWVTADPQPIDCEEGLQLFFANLPLGAKQTDLGPQGGQGLWHASSLPEGAALATPGGTVAAQSGRDFIVARPGSNGISADQLVPDKAHSGEHGARIFIDPDPVRMGDGSFIVFSGTLDRAGVYRFDGTSEAGCRPWQKAFDP